MPIHISLTGDECIQQYEVAAQNFYNAGLKLLCDGDAVGVQLMGQGVEMQLKAAYFSYVKGSETAAISRADLVVARNEARNVFRIVANEEGFHNLQFWAELLISKRARAVPAAPFSAAIITEMRRVVSSISDNYKITDRYRDTKSVATKEDLDACFDDCMWIDGHYPDLKR